MRAGKLVDDSIVLGMIRERLAQPDTAGGFILDGFPRNLAQANALDALLAEIGQPLSGVVLLEVDNRELTRRIAGRRSCPNCGSVYNIYSLPIGSDLRCTNCAPRPELVQRPDDNEETVVHRLRVYDEQTRPLVDYYRGKGLLRTIDAQADVDVVTVALVAALSQPAEQAAAPKRRAKARPRAKPKAKAKARPAARKQAAKKKPAKKKPARKKATRAPVKRRPKRKPARKAAGRPAKSKARPKKKAKKKLARRR
jgi:adenylate kinase